MKKFLALALLMMSTFSTAAFASEAAPGSTFNYTFFGNSSGRYTMVACSYAEYVAADFMEKLGATEVSIQCTGGIEPWGIRPLTIRATYTAPDLSEGGQTETVLIESDGRDANCSFDTGLMRALLRDFPNAKKVRASDACFNHDSHYSYELEVTSK